MPEVATVRKEGVSDSGKPDTAINEGKGKDAAGGGVDISIRVDLSKTLDIDRRVKELSKEAESLGFYIKYSFVELHQ